MNLMILIVVLNLNTIVYNYIFWYKQAKYVQKYITATNKIEFD